MEQFWWGVIWNLVLENRGKRRTLWRLRLDRCNTHSVWGIHDFDVYSQNNQHSIIKMDIHSSCYDQPVMKKGIQRKDYEKNECATLKRSCWKGFKFWKVGADGYKAHGGKVLSGRGRGGDDLVVWRIQGNLGKRERCQNAIHGFKCVHFVRQAEEDKNECWQSLQNWSPPSIWRH